MSRPPPRWRQLWQALALAALVLVLPAVAYVQAKAVPTRDVLFEWDAEAKLLYLSVGFRDVIDQELQAKLSRGLPTTIVLTAAIYRAGGSQPLSTTAHTCFRIGPDTEKNLLVNLYTESVGSVPNVYLEAARSEGVAWD